MGMKVTFRLRNNQPGKPPIQQKETPIIMFVSFGYYEVDNKKNKKYIPVKYSTGENIKPCNWNGRRAKQTSKFDHDNFNTRLENLEICAKSALLELKNENILITPGNLKNRINEFTGRKVKDHIPSLNEFIEQFINDIESGEILTEKDKRFSYSTIKYIKGFKSQFNQFQKKRGIKYNYDDINMDIYHDFIKYFTEKDYSLNTMGKYIGTLKQIMNVSKSKDYHSNNQYNQKAFKKPQAKAFDIYLSETEVKKIYDLNLNETLGLARDIFLVGCYTSLRYSDYGRIHQDNIKVFENGNKVIVINQQKTGDNVIIPIRAELEVILKRHNYNLPKTYAQKINKRIKDVGRLAKIDEELIIEKIKGGLVVKVKTPKYKLIKTHTARRTGITNMYKAGIPIIDIMKISGHMTEKEFLKYIKISQEETAIRLGDHPYFIGNPLKVVN